MLMPLGDHASHWSNLLGEILGEILREFPMHYPSWHKIEAERKAGVLGKISSVFVVHAIRPLAKNQEGHRATFGQDLHRQRRRRQILSHADWDAQLAFWLNPKN
ncbi:hypothetical protein Tco_1395193, partial [Tanacetum coccineum]